MLEKSDTHRTDRGKEGQVKATRDILDELEQIDGRTGFRRNNKTKLIKSYNGQEYMEGHDRLHPEMTQHIKEEVLLSGTNILFADFICIWWTIRKKTIFFLKVVMSLRAFLVLSGARTRMSQNSLGNIS